MEGSSEWSGGSVRWRERHAKTKLRNSIQDILLNVTPSEPLTLFKNISNDDYFIGPERQDEMIDTYAFLLSCSKTDGQTEERVVIIVVFLRFETE